MAFQRAHGLTLAQNGYVENMVVETLSSDPTVVEPGRCWFNDTSKLFKFSTLDGGGQVIVRSIKDKEDYDTFVASVTSQTGGSSGAHNVGYDGQVGSNGQLTLSSGTVASALDLLLDNVDQALQDLDDVTGGSGTSLSGLQTELDTTQTGAGLATDGQYSQPSGSNYLDSSTSLADADDKLDAQAKTNADAISTEATNRANADDLKVDLAGDTMGGNLGFASTYRITGLAEPVDSADAATKNYVDAFSAGLDPKESARLASTANIDLATGGLIDVDGVTVVAGDRVLVRAQSTASQNGIYVAVDGGAWTRATDFDGTPANEVSGGSFCFVEEGTAYANMGFVVQWSGNVTVDTDPINWVQFSGAGQITAGAGISKTGNEIYLNFGAGIVELPGDEIGIDLYATGGLHLTEDGTTSSTTAAAEIGIKLDGTTLTLGASGLKVSDTLTGDVSGIQTELDNTQTGAGLGTGGSYVPHASGDYIDSAVSLSDADLIMATQIKFNADGLASEITNRGNADTSIQNEVDAIETGAGLSAAGAYTPPASNYLSGSTDIVDGMSQLDTAIKANEDDIAQEVTDRGLAVSNEATARGNADTTLQGNITTLNNEVDAVEAALGAMVSTAGAYVAHSGSNYIDGNADVTADLLDLDAQVKTNADDITAITGTSITGLQTEVDAIETAMGGVIGASGGYVAHSGTNYIDGNTSVTQDLTDLDTGLDSAQDEINAMEAALGAAVSAAGAYVAHSGTNYIDGNASITADLLDLDTSLKAVSDARGNAQTEIDALETSLGAVVSASGTYVAHTTSNFIDGNTSITTDLLDLDSALQSEITNRGNAVSTLQTEVDAIETAMGGVIGASGAYVAHTGTNYINGNSDLTADLTDLDTQLKTVTDGLTTEVTNRTNDVDNSIDALETAIDALVYTFTSGAAATSHTVNHSLNDQMVDVTVWVKDDDLKYRNDLVGVTITDSNNVTVDLTESRDVKVIVRSTAALSSGGE